MEINFAQNEGKPALSQSLQGFLLLARPSPKPQQQYISFKFYEIKGSDNMIQI